VPTAYRPPRPRLTAALLLGAGLAGCNAPYARDERVIDLVRSADFGPAYAAAARSAQRDPADRSYMLDQVKLLQLALAEGVPEAADDTAARLYDFLRTQGVNADKALPTFFVGEGASRIWKGEPFEQAMALAYIAMLDATRGDWGNARAAAANALFQVRDFSKTLAAEQGPGDERQRLLRAAAKQGSSDSPEALERLAQPAPSDFELGYLLRALAAHQLGETADRDEALAQLVRIAPRLKPLADRVASGPAFNTVLVVDFGLGPRKIAYGEDNALAGFRAVTASDERPLLVRVAEREPESFPIATDLNRLAQDLRWNNLEDLRLAKSATGTGMILGGAVLAGSSDNTEVNLAGLGVLLAGLALKSTAAADTRHNELLPQRTYVALLNLPEGNPNLDLQVDGFPNSRLVLTGLNPPPTGTLLFRYVRLPMVSEPWTTSGQILYSNDATGSASLSDSADSAATADPDLPFILGGRCVRTPTEATLSIYQRAGHLRGFTLNDLLDLYRDESIATTLSPPQAAPARGNRASLDRHILEGGKNLYTPLPGSTGFARLFGTRWPAYAPRSPRLRELATPQIAPAPTAPARAAASAGPDMGRPSSVPPR
jgi:hypothetical protein